MIIVEVDQNLKFACTALVNFHTKNGQQYYILIKLINLKTSVCVWVSLLHYVWCAMTVVNTRTLASSHDSYMYADKKCV